MTVSKRARKPIVSGKKKGLGHGAGAPSEWVIDPKAIVDEVMHELMHHADGTVDDLDIDDDLMEALSRELNLSPLHSRGDDDSDDADEFNRLVEEDWSPLGCWVGRRKSSSRIAFLVVALTCCGNVRDPSRAQQVPWGPWVIAATPRPNASLSTISLSHVSACLPGQG